jgi:hypothetical protein
MLTLTDNAAGTTNTVLAKTCTNAGNWVNATAPACPALSGLYYCPAAQTIGSLPGHGARHSFNHRGGEALVERWKSEDRSAAVHQYSNSQHSGFSR